jgi:hypothetical protein
MTTKTSHKKGKKRKSDDVSSGDAVSDNGDKAHHGGNNKDVRNGSPDGGGDDGGAENDTHLAEAVLYFESCECLRYTGIFPMKSCLPGKTSEKKCGQKSS